MKYAHILTEFLNTPWAITPAKLQAIASFLTLKVQGGDVPQAAIEAMRTEKREPSTQGAVAIVPVHGVLNQRISMLEAMSGGSSVEMIGKQLKALDKDPDIGKVVMDFHSPGGGVFGIPETAEIIHGMSKPVFGIANSLSASASYWLMAACEEVWITPSGESGSIGVYAAHNYIGKALEQEGEEVTLISAGKHKVEGNPFEPLSGDARKEMQRRVDEYYSMFTESVAKYRGDAVENVVNGYGQGRTLSAKDSVKVNLADKVGTIDGLIAYVMPKRTPGANRNAIAQRKLALASADG